MLHIAPREILLLSVISYRIKKMLSYRSQTALQGAFVLAQSGRLELGDNILWTL